VDQAVVGRHPPGPDDRLDPGQQVPVAQYRSFGSAGRPGSEADEGRVVGAALVDRARVAVRQFERRAGDHDPSGPGGSHPRRLFRALHHRSGCADVGHDVGQLASRVGSVGRYHDQAGPQRPHVGHQPVDRRVGGPHDPLPWLQPGSPQTTGGPAGRLLELACRPPTTVAVPQRRHWRRRPAPGPQVDQSSGRRQIRRTATIVSNQGVVRLQMITPRAHDRLLVPGGPGG